VTTDDDHEPKSDLCRLVRDNSPRTTTTTARPLTPPAGYERRAHLQRRGHRKTGVVVHKPRVES
jgi:hypothetical protein